MVVKISNSVWKKDAQFILYNESYHSKSKPPSKQNHKAKQALENHPQNKHNQNHINYSELFFVVWNKKREMVFYFKARPEAGDYTIFMGLDKYENEELIKYGFPEDIWYLFFSYQFLANPIQSVNLCHLGLWFID